MPNSRNLTDADVEAIAERIRSKMIAEFYQDLGRGMWGLIKKGLFIFACSIAASGAYEHIRSAIERGHQ